MSRYFSQILQKRYSRRNFAVKASLLAATTAMTSGFSLGSWFGDDRNASAPLTFAEVPHSLTDNLELSPGYEAKVLLRWGDKIFKDAPSFDFARQSPAAQEKQFGYNNDYISYMPLPLGSDNPNRGLLCVNHEYVNPELMFSGYRENKVNRRQVETMLASLGVSIVEVRKNTGGWQVAEDSKYNRRISGLSTICRVSGPAKNSLRLATSYDPENKGINGTLANCGGGKTPWGTILVAEENFDVFFSGVPSNLLELVNYQRYFLGKNRKRGKETAFSKYFPRFDLDKEPAEQNRYGWLVEIDPYDPNYIPVKRTALGRFKHEAAAIAVCADGRVAVYSADDQEFEYIYKFVSKGKFNPNDREANRNLLDEGTLYVARFNSDGECIWMPLRHGEGQLTERNYFQSQADVVIETRLAADLMRPTKMDRPEDIEISPVTGTVFLALTGNESRKENQVDKANPRANNKYGQIIKLIPPLLDGKPDHAAEKCRWDIFLVAGNPLKDKGTVYNKKISKNGYFANPDNLAFDPKGRLWIATDGQPKNLTNSDSVYAVEVSGEDAALPKHFLNVPRGAEATGPEFTPDGKTLFLSVQHPGEGTSLKKPSTRWPDFDSRMPPRPAVIAVTKKGNRVIGG